MFKRYFLTNIFVVFAVIAYSQPYDTAAISTRIKKIEQIAERSPDSAAPLLRQVLKECEDAKFMRGIGMLEIPLFNAYNSIGWEDSTIVIFQQLLDNYHSSVASLKEIEAEKLYNCLGILYQLKGLHETAMQYYLKTIDYVERYNHTINLSTVYNNIGSELIGLHRPNEALPYLDKAETMAIKPANYYILGLAYTNKGVCYRDLKNWNKSEFYFKKAIEVCRKYGQQDVLYLALTDLGSLYLDMTELLNTNELQKALHCLLETQTLQSSPYNETEALRMLGRAYTLLSDYKRGDYFLQKAIRIADAHHLSKGAFEARKALSFNYARSGNYKDAYNNVTAYISARDSVESQEVTQNLSQMEVRYRTAEKDKEIIRNQLQISRAESRLRQKNIWIISICAGALILFIVLLFLYRSYQQRQRLQAQKMRTMQQEQEISQLVAVMKGEENERGRLSRELHDGIGGMLASINMKLGAIQAGHPYVANLQSMDEVVDMLNDTSTEVRKTAHNLMPDILIRNNLQDALAIYCRQNNTNENLQINLHYDDALILLDKSVELIIYRIIQELLQNIMKHAKATIADIQLLKDGNILCISVEDNGVGFDSSGHYSGSGLQNLRYRVQALQGNISIMSKNGTTVLIEFNLDKLKNSVAV